MGRVREKQKGKVRGKQKGMVRGKQKGRVRGKQNAIWGRNATYSMCEGDCHEFIKIYGSTSYTEGVRGFRK